MLNTFTKLAVGVAVALALALPGFSQQATTSQYLRMKGLAAAKAGDLERRAKPLSQKEIVETAAKIRAATNARAASAFRSRRQSFAGPASASSQIHVPRVAVAKAQTSGLQIQWHESNGTPVSIAVSAETQKQNLAKIAAATSAAQIALSFLNENRELLRLDNPVEELQVAEEHTDQLGKRHVKFTQHYHGIPVWAHDLVAHVEPDGRLYAINARYSPSPGKISLEHAAITADQALMIASNELGARAGIEMLPSALQELLHYQGPQATRYIWIHPTTLEPRLVWHVQIRPNLVDEWFFFIDAGSGEILERYNNTKFDGPRTAQAFDLNSEIQTVHSYQISNTYFLIDASRPIWQAQQPNIINDARGALVTLDVRNTDLERGVPLYHVTSQNNQWQDRTAVSAHANVGKVFEYYLNTHGRRAIDGEGSTMVSLIHVTEDGQGMDNAYWNGSFMIYGDGDKLVRPMAGALDVAAHEMTHGVIQHTVGLEYKFQSGALNESLADIFAAFVDREDWLLAEDVVLPDSFPSGAMRDLANPHNGGAKYLDNGWQPAHVNEFVTLPIYRDNGGVHANSGIPNHAAYLIAQALGREKTEKIYYRVLDARYLNYQSLFVDMRLAALQAATDLYGANSPEVNAVAAGFQGVGIGVDTPKPADDLPPVVGEQWIAAVNADVTDNSLYLVRPVINSGADIVQLTPTQVFTGTSRPMAVSSDGDEIMFVDADNFIRAIYSDGTEEEVMDNQNQWKSIAWSPDGTKLALTRLAMDTTIYILNLFDPAASFTVNLADELGTTVLFADALDWSANNRFVLFDAFHRKRQSNGEPIEYWDMNVLKVLTKNRQIQTLFWSRPAGVSMANPSFAQNNDGFIAFDWIDDNKGTVEIVIANLYTEEIALIEPNGSSFGFPHFSTDDKRLVFQRIENGVPTLRQVALLDDMGGASGPSENYVTGGQLPSWFAIGARPTGVEEEPGTLPVGFALLQNYPNPFNPETTIGYSLPLESEVSLAIYDLTGRLILELAEGRQAAGDHRVLWNGRDRAGRSLPSGVYFYRLQAIASNGLVSTSTKKLTMLK
jgi:Zn-dependent metalloprotease